MDNAAPVSAKAKMYVSMALPMLLGKAKAGDRWAKAELRRRAKAKQ